MCVLKDKEYFVSKSKENHGDFYNYEKVVYVNSKTKVLITCPLHGDFWQVPQDHYGLKKCGCPECGKQRIAKFRSLDKETVMHRFNEIHGGKYNYPDFEYKGIKHEIEVVCPRHGSFMQTVDGHLSGKGCRQCGIESASKSRSIGNDEFISRSRKVHGDFYDYSLADYKSSKTKVRIICPKHGEFEQYPDAHMRGHRCKLCAYLDVNYIGGFGDKLEYYKDNPDKAKLPASLYVLKFEYDNETYYKVGMTAVAGVEYRKRSLERSANTIAEVIFQGTATSVECYVYEQQIIKSFEEYLCKPDKTFKGWTESVVGVDEETLLQEVGKFNNPPTENFYAEW